MAKSIEEICELYRLRQQANGLLLGKARELTDAYNGDLVVPLPELDKNERVALPNLLRKGLDQTATRINSTLADVTCPADKPGQKASEAAALTRRKAVLGWWQDNSMGLMMGRRARHLLGYACSPVRIRWDFDKGIPRWTLGDPLSTFPAKTENPDDPVPSDCIFACRRSLAWLQRKYPDQMWRLSKGDKPTPDRLFDVIEYIDCDEVVVAVIGQPTGKDAQETPIWASSRPVAQGRMEEELERVPNRVGEPLAVVAGSIALERRESAYNGMIGLFQAGAKLMALEVIAVTEGVWPKTWLVGKDGQVPEVIVEADPKHGITGVVRGGAIEQTQLQPGYKTTDTIDRLYQAQLVDGGVPPDMTGQAGTNIRTGRRADTLNSAVIDFPIQEAHTIFEHSLEAENRIAIATAKTYGKGKRTFYLNWKNAKGKVDYDPAQFTSTVNFVSYPQAGADINQLVVGLGQRLATRQMSRPTARRLDPWIDDPDFEERQTTADALEDMLLAAVGQDVQKGTYTAVEVAQMRSRLEENPEMTLADVIAKVQQEHQERQAAETPPNAPQMQPGLTPGPAGPGGMANAGPPSTMGPPPGGIGPTGNEQGLAGLLGALHAPVAAANG